MKRHHGRSMKRIREIQHIKQSVIADALSKTLEESWDQSKVSLLEDKEEIDDDLLQIIAPLLNVTPDIIKNFDADAAVNIVTNNNHGENSSAVNIHYQSNVNPIDKLVEVFEENKKLYEQLLATEREKSELLKTTNKELQALLKHIGK